jgi:predicted RNA-binding Zn-ribbon protein involved in translation (DUF1610 family)
MSETVVFECPQCGDRKLVTHNQQLHPTIWCNCGGGNFKTMDVDPESLTDE